MEWSRLPYQQPLNMGQSIVSQMAMLTDAAKAAMFGASGSGSPVPRLAPCWFPTGCHGVRGDVPFG